MEKNNKGFMMAEIVVVSAVIITTVVGLYTGFNRVYKSFNERSKYYDIDGLYCARNINDLLIKDLKLGTIETPSNITSMAFSNDKQWLFNDLKSSCFIENIYLVKYDTINLTNINETFKEYLIYLNNNLDFGDSYSYLILVEKKLDDKYYYASYRVR